MIQIGNHEIAPLTLDAIWEQLMIDPSILMELDELNRWMDGATSKVDDVVPSRLPLDSPVKAVDFFLTKAMQGDSVAAQSVLATHPANGRRMVHMFDRWRDFMNVNSKKWKTLDISFGNVRMINERIAHISVKVALQHTRVTPLLLSTLTCFAGATFLAISNVASPNDFRFSPHRIISILMLHGLLGALAGLVFGALLFRNKRSIRMGKLVAEKDGAWFVVNALPETRLDNLLTTALLHRE